MNDGNIQAALCVGASLGAWGLSEVYDRHKKNTRKRRVGAYRLAGRQTVKLVQEANIQHETQYKKSRHQYNENLYEVIIENKAEKIANEEIINEQLEVALNTVRVVRALKTGKTEKGCPKAAINYIESQKAVEESKRRRVRLLTWGNSEKTEEQTEGQLMLTDSNDDTSSTSCDPSSMALAIVGSSHERSSSLPCIPPTTPRQGSSSKRRRRKMTRKVSETTLGSETSPSTLTHSLTASNLIGSALSWFNSADDLLPKNSPSNRSKKTLTRTKSTSRKTKIVKNKDRLYPVDFTGLSSPPIIKEEEIWPMEDNKLQQLRQQLEFLTPKKRDIHSHQKMRSL